MDSPAFVLLDPLVQSIGTIFKRYSGAHLQVTIQGYLFIMVALLEIPYVNLQVELIR